MKHLQAVTACLVVCCVCAYTFVIPHGVSLSPIALLGRLAGSGVAYAEEAWRKEFDDICSRTEGSMALTKEELRELIGRGEKLKTVVGTLDESTKKVFLKRLQMCMDLYKYLYEVKENK